MISVITLIPEKKPKLVKKMIVIIKLLKLFFYRFTRYSILNDII